MVETMKTIILFMLLLVFSPVTEILAFTDEEKAEKLELIKQLKSKGETVFAIVPKLVDEPFMDDTGQGCIETAKKMGIHCVYYGSFEQNPFLQENDILALISAGIDGIAIASIKEGWLAERIGEKLKQWGKPVVAFDSPLSTEIAQTYIGSDNYLLGRTLGNEITKLRPNGGTYCIQTGRPDSHNHRDRFEGIMDALTNDGQDKEKWINTAGCPLYHFGDDDRSWQQVARLFGKSGIDIFIVTGGGPQFRPEKYRKLVEPFKNNLKTGKLMIANMDTIPAQIEFLKERIATVNVGQRPYEMGKWSVRILKLLVDGELPPAIIYTGMTICTQNNTNTCTK
jgi:ribose transport system substrate-binding protein